MKRYKITMLVPFSKEVVVVDAQAAHNEATKLASAHALADNKKAIITSIEFVNNVQTEVLDL